MGEQHCKSVSKKFQSFYNFLRGFLSGKLLKIALKTHEIAQFIKIFLEACVY